MLKEKEKEKIDEYMDLAADVRTQFRVNSVILPIVLRALEQSKQSYQNL